ncbi:MAG TPA: type III polyketide synthase [Daejeonella sp.]|nr:type III polyketide synthase [Daejeonella sp.]
MSSCISAIGTANPPHRIPQKSIYHFMVNAFNLDENNASRLKQIYDHSGIEYRHSVIPDFGETNYRNHTFFSASKNLEPFPGTRHRLQLYQQTAAEVAGKAIDNCLQQFSKNLIPQITHLITVSCTGMHAPGIDIELVEKLGLNRHVERTCINFMGCYGALNALKVADYICRANEKAKALIVCIELCTLHFQKENTLDNWVANALFSDGAAAVLIENQAYKTTAPHQHFKLNTFYSEFMHEAGPEMGWQVGNSGFEMKLTSKVPKLIRSHINGITQRLLTKAGLNLADINRFAVHPGGKKILEAAETALGFDPCANHFAYETLREYGNMSSATVLFVLKKLLEDPQARSGEYVLGFAFGPGLTVESMILQRH